MESRLRIAGQAVQPILVAFPLGLFVMAGIFDVADLSGGPAILGSLGYWNVVAGLIAGGLAVLAGAIDLIFVRRPLAKRIGVLRVLLNMATLILFAVILMVRVGEPERQVGVGLFLVELLAIGVAGFGAWFAGALASGRTPAFARAAVEHRGY
ncbi:DUF2231 domain-containing protein [Actinoplanes sp. NPDC051411]|uniref:DUF2231 domain-containing protein n=1 Tax=Actinoplanes sp. NPDC051411 TaxID=3155522 RepID=UPI00343FC700